jgi:NFACT N-terminal and middle domains/NFACT protein RNA binding domain
VHLNTFFLYHLAPALARRLQGSVVAACFSQEKDELVIGFADEAARREVWIRAVLTNNPTALSFPAEYRRARQNSVDLFSEIIGQGVTNVYAHFGDRSLHLVLTDGSALYFKLHGARANVVWVPPADAPGRVPVLFRRKLREDAGLTQSALAALAAPDAHAISTALPPPLTSAHLPKYYGDIPTLWLREQHYDSAEPATKIGLWQALQTALLHPEAYFLTELSDRLHLSLLPLGPAPAAFADPLMAAEEFTRRFRSTHAFAALYARAHRHVQRTQEAALRASAEVERRLRHLAADASYRQTADIIMANLTQIPAGATEADLFDFYQNQSRRIKLRGRELSPQRVAENLYRKAKNQQREVQELQERLTRYETAALRALDQLPALEALAPAADFRQLRQWLREQGLTDELNQSKADAALPATPFKEFESYGYRILVGRSAANNDELTLRHARKDDLWLHAKDVAGSHVVIRRPNPTQPVPRPVIEQAAALAAWYSKRKSDSLCPVIVTARKYVRKPRGAAPGSVRVEREEQVLLVRPANPFERE